MTNTKSELENKNSKTVAADDVQNRSPNATDVIGPDVPRSCSIAG